MTPEQEAELAGLIDTGPEFERDGVVRSRCVDLRQVILSRWNGAIRSADHSTISSIFWLWADVGMPCA